MLSLYLSANNIYRSIDLSVNQHKIAQTQISNRKVSEFNITGLIINPILFLLVKTGSICIIWNT